MPRLERHCLTNGAFQQNCWLLADTERREAVLVDPGEAADDFLRILDARGLTLTAIWITHAHLDHIMGAGAVARASGAPISLHPADRPLWDAMPQQAAQFFGLALEPLPPPDATLTDGQQLAFGGETFTVRHAPGHSPGHVVFLAEGVALVGDVLFAGSVGRSDLPGGHGPTLLASITRTLLSLPDATVVCPGHGPETTIGEERRTNPFLSGLRCQRCGFPVPSRPWGCKNPCPNCGVVYPLGDCSD